MQPYTQGVTIEELHDSLESGIAASQRLTVRIYFAVSTFFGKVALLFEIADLNFFVGAGVRYA